MILYVILYLHLKSLLTAKPSKEGDAKLQGLKLQGLKWIFRHASQSARPFYFGRICCGCSFSFFSFTPILSLPETGVQMKKNEEGISHA